MLSRVTRRDVHLWTCHGNWCFAIYFSSSYFTTNINWTDLWPGSKYIQYRMQASDTCDFQDAQLLLLWWLTWTSVYNFLNFSANSKLTFHSRHPACFLKTGMTFSVAVKTQSSVVNVSYSPSIFSDRSQVILAGKSYLWSLENSFTVYVGGEGV